MSTITEFLEARIAEDEAEAKPMAAMEDDDRGGWAIAYADRVLLECAAKRQVIDLHEAFGSGDEPGAKAMWIATGGILKVLATVYSDHPDYQQEWTP